MTTRHAQSPAVPADVRVAQGFEPAQSAGIFVGVSRFDDDLFLPVPFAVDDAVDLAHFFAFELRLITPAKMVLGLAGKPQKPDSIDRLGALRGAGAEITSAHQTEIYTRLDAQRRAAGAGGLLVAALATHGFSDQGGDFLVAEDSLRRRIERTGVAVAEMFDDVARSPSPRRLVLLDACRERLSADTRAGSEARAAMSRSFAAAIAGASGQAVLAGATLGGYAYDDPARRNGVFTGAVLDGLSGRADVDERGFITVRTLADYVDRHVVEWVRDHRPDHAGVSQGIARRIEGEASRLPLAVDPVRRQIEKGWRARRDAALVRLRENFGEAITGAFYDQVAEILGGDGPQPDLEPLLEEIEALDGEARSQRSLAYYFQQHFSRHQAAPGGSELVAAPLVSPLEPTAVDPESESGQKADPGKGAGRRRWALAAATLAAVAVASWVWWQLSSISQAPPTEAEVDSGATSPPPASEEDTETPEARGARPSPPPPAVQAEPSTTVRGTGEPDARDVQPSPPPPAQPEPAEPGRDSGPAPERREAGDPWTGPLEMRFRYVPAGRFQMGSPDTETERDDDEVLHEVELTRGFWMGETEVTQAQWRQLMKSSPSRFGSCGDDCPVENVNWYEAVTFANQLSKRAKLTPCYTTEGCQGSLGGGCAEDEIYCSGDYSCKVVAMPALGCTGLRLPTEAEWEYAARARTKTPFSTGSNLTTAQANYDGNYPYAGGSKGEYRKTTMPVRSFDPNPWKLYEVHGNVYEWTWDWFGDYPESTEADPTGAERGSSRVVRGGSWFGYARRCRSANRYRSAPGNRGADVGFRLVRTAD